MLFVHASYPIGKYTVPCEGGSTEREEKAMTDFVNSYDITDRLSEKFQVIHETGTATQMERNIQNRLLCGFENWNRGFDAWRAWGNILYTEDSIYNVHGVRMTLKEYQAAMDVLLKKTDVQLGDFYSMIICGDWCMIHYNTNALDPETGRVVQADIPVMECVHFKDYGPELGTRVVEGWGGPKDSAYRQFTNFIPEEKRKQQEEAWNRIASMDFHPGQDLSEKYPVINRTPDYGEDAGTIRNILLQDFEAWNRGEEAWKKFLKENAVSDLKMVTENSDGAYLKGSRRMYFDNMLIRNRWAAIHYEISYPDADGTRQAKDVMQFIEFVREDGRIRIARSWMQ